MRVKSAMAVVCVSAVFAIESCGSGAKPGDAGPDVLVTDGKGDNKVVDPPPQDDCCAGCSLSCEICDVTGFSVSPMGKPIGPNAGKCTSAQLGSFDTQCLSSSATQTTCSAWEKDANNAGCLACAVTQDISATWGPLVCTSIGCSVNVAGCLDLALGEVGQENGTNGSCGDLLNASYECQDYACGACNVAADGGPDPVMFQACVDATLQTDDCKSYGAAFDNASQCSALHGDALPPAVQVCFAADPKKGFTEQEVLAAVTYFCGP